MKTNLDRILKILTSRNENYHNIYCKRKRLRIESENEIKDADNEENTVKAGSRRWPLHVFYNRF